MKFILSLVAAITILSVNTSSAQGGKASPHDTVKTKQVTVTYGRPYKKGREIFGGLVPYGSVWRVGADQATEITFAQDVKFAGQGVAKGTYTLFAIPGENEWTIILNSQLGQWGAFKYDQYKDKDVLKAKVPAKKAAKETEQLTIKAEKAALVIVWDKTEVSVPMNF